MTTLQDYAIGWERLKQGGTMTGCAILHDFILGSIAKVVESTIVRHTQTHSKIK